MKKRSFGLQEMNLTESQAKVKEKFIKFFSKQRSRTVYLDPFECALMDLILNIENMMGIWEDD